MELQYQSNVQDNTTRKVLVGGAIVVGVLALLYILYKMQMQVLGLLQPWMIFALIIAAMAFTFLSNKQD